MGEERRPLRSLVRAGDHVANFIALLLALLLLLYSAYSIWYTYSLTHGSFLSDDLAMYKPDGTTPTLADLMKENRDVRAWLTIDETHIDYPVVQGADNWEYLNKDVMGDFSLAGAIFLDSANAPDFSDPYNMIYGHHIEGGAMFSDVLEFRTASFFETHKTGTLWLADEAYHVDIFACVEAGATDPVIYQDPATVTPGSLPGVVEDIMSVALHTRAMDITEEDSIIGLSTCENAEGFGRVLIFGKLTAMTEVEMDALMVKNQEEPPASLESSRPERWYAPILRHPRILLSAGVALIILILLLVLPRRKKRLSSKQAHAILRPTVEEEE